MIGSCGARKGVDKTRRDEIVVASGRRRCRASCRASFGSGMRAARSFRWRRRERRSGFGDGNQSRCPVRISVGAREGRRGKRCFPRCRSLASWRGRITLRSSLGRWSVCRRGCLEARRTNPRGLMIVVSRYRSAFEWSACACVVQQSFGWGEPPILAFQERRFEIPVKLGAYPRHGTGVLEVRRDDQGRV